MKWSHFCLIASAIWITPHIEAEFAYVMGFGALAFGVVMAFRGE